MIPFPNIDPIAVQIGPFAVHWYALAYVVGILGGWWYAKLIEERIRPKILTKKALEDIVIYVALGIILGGRLGYILFYNFPFYIENPVTILKLWQGGMSFHGGLLGVIFGLYLFAKKFKIKFLQVTDLVAIVTPIGIFFGRIANFINGELYGRTTSVSWGIIFPMGGDLPRHPSQLYEAFSEGFILFFILFFLVFFTKAKEKTGLISGVFLSFYGTFRFIIEYFREPDEQIGLIFESVSMGQILCIPMILLGIFLIYQAQKSRAAN